MAPCRSERLAQLRLERFQLPDIACHHLGNSRSNVAMPARSARLAAKPASRGARTLNSVLAVVTWTLVAFSRAASGGDGPVLPSLERAHALASKHISGDLAYDITAFVEQRWRLPGNPGFDESIRRVVEALNAAGYVEENIAGPGARLTYRVEHRPLQEPAWEPVRGTLTLVDLNAELEEDVEQLLLDFKTNRNMMAINSTSTGEPVEAMLVDVGFGDNMDDIGVAGKIVLGEGNIWQLHREAMRHGALGVLAYNMPDYTQPQVHQDSIQFSSISRQPGGRGWGILISYRVRELLHQRLKKGPVRLLVDLQTKFHEAEELTLVAEVRGEAAPEQRFVLSAHVQEPGANDNASGMGCLAEAATALAKLVNNGDVSPARTITMIWGDEITAPMRYVQEDAARSANVRWGLSLDMVGEDTSKTGGTFLIEKMPDPSAIWTRGEEKHTEWGAPRPPRVDSLKPHYYNDLALACCQREARDTGWVVKTNPYEGGSDHVPFLRANKPGLLFWHFTDVFYHTDGDRLEMVSKDTLRHSGISTLTLVLMLAAPAETTIRDVLTLLEYQARQRLDTEVALSRTELANGSIVAAESRIIRAWTDWYRGAAGTATDIAIREPTSTEQEAIQRVQARIEAMGDAAVKQLNPESSADDH